MAGEKILIIEDNPMNMELTTDLLKVSGYVIIQAETAEEGIAMAREQLPDLIIMDIGLPVMDGLSAVEILKKDEKTKDIPILALTSYAMKGDREKILEAGCEGYLAKPIDTRKFADEVRAILKKV
ncbi:MAG: response regulator [Candidatus Aminicenantes bacterium]|nr:MAG: response regulator [Candidatus Aminicenantes bacterium]